MMLLFLPHSEKGYTLKGKNVSKGSKFLTTSEKGVYYKAIDSVLEGEQNDPCAYL